MATDFINRNGILDKLASKFCAYCPLPDCDTNCKLHYLLDAVKEEPAADVRPVVRGKWKERRFSEDVYGAECSVCHTTWDYGTNFCPNCGADMREVKDE